MRAGPVCGLLGTPRSLVRGAVTAALGPMLAASATGATVRATRASAIAAPAVFNIASSCKGGEVQGLASVITCPTEFALPDERNLCGRNGEECELALTTAKNFMQFLSAATAAIAIAARSG